jgi:glycosyltransferase involved in cell wall biosynthesis
MSPPSAGSMAEALVLCPEAPYPVAGGGPLRSACLLEYLASKYEVDVIVFREPGAADPRDAFPPAVFRSITVVELPYHSKSTAARILRNATRYVRSAPPLVDRFSGFRLPITRDYELGVVEHFWCAPYIEQLGPRCRRVVLDLHNIESALLDRCSHTERALGRIAMRRFARACGKLEAKLLPRFDTLLVTSEADGRHVKGAVVWPNTIPLVSIPSVAKQNAVVFSGNMAYHPNAAAIRYFYRDVWPRLEGVEWWLVGKNPEALKISGSGIRVLGAVPDAIAAIAPAKVAVVPLLSGSGTRFKILEAWAAGVPVVSTTLGAEGLDAIPGVHLLIADNAEDFAGAVTHLLNAPTEGARLAAAGRALYEAKFTWPSAWKLLAAAGM